MITSRMAGMASVLCFVHLLIVTPSFGQQDSAGTLRIRFATGTSLFRVGEVIPLELSFSSQVSDTYKIDMANYDRSGRLDADEFHVRPEGRDPLENHFKSGLFGFMGGGIRGIHVLSSEPDIIREELNEWVALDKPGRYTVEVISHRLSRTDEEKHIAVEVRSNTLEFEVVEADAAWQAQTLMTAVSILNGTSSTDEEKVRAERTLRFLDTPGAIREMARQVALAANGYRWNSSFGLMGARRQDLVLEELNAQFPASDTALSAQFLHLVAETEFFLKHPNGKLSPYPANDVEKQKICQREQEGLLKEFDQLYQEKYQEAASVLNLKHGAARAESVQALLLREERGSPGPKAPMRLPEQEIATAFLALSPQQQADMLMVAWDKYRVPALAGALEKILDQPDLQQNMLRALALERLYDLDPNEGKARILSEIRKPHMDAGSYPVSAKVLSSLPSETLPEFDEILARRLEDPNSRTKDLDAQLAGRYATKAILARIKLVYEVSPGKWACAMEDGLISYFLRIDADYGVKQMAKASSQCMSESMSRLKKMKRWGEIEPAVITRLDDEHVWVARDAAEALSKYGGPKAEKAMWARLRSFHAQWAEREKEFRTDLNPKQDVSDAVGFQFALVEGIAKARGWLLDNDQITELENLTLGQERENIARLKWKSPVNLSINFVFEGQLNADFNSQYLAADIETLCVKLAQYPNGTRFWMNVFGATEEQLEPVLRAIDETAGQHGFVIDRAPAN